MRKFLDKIYKEMKACYISMIKFKQMLLWYIQYWAVKYVTHQKTETHQLHVSRLGRTLIIAPHADDELIGCYHLIKKCGNASVYYCRFYGGNNHPQNVRTRDKEIADFAHRMQISLYNDSDNLISLAELLKNEHFDTIIFPSPYDWHPEHRKIAEMVIEATPSDDNRTAFYYYNVSMPFPSKWDRRLVTVNFSEEEQDEKWQVFYNVYVSQRHMPILRYKLQERVDGKFPSEEYVRRNLREISEDINCINNRAESLCRLNQCMNKIGNIYVMHKLSQTNFGVDEVD